MVCSAFFVQLFNPIRGIQWVARYQEVCWKSEA